MFPAAVVGMTPQEALAGLTPDMIDADGARSWVLQRVSPDGGTCPECGLSVDTDQLAAWHNDKRLRCRHCGRFFTNRSSSPFDGCTLGWRDIYLVLVLIAAGCTPDEIASRVSVHPRTIKRLQQRLLVAP